MATLGRNITFPIYNADGTPFNDLVIHKATFDSVVMSLGDKITGDVYYKDNTLAVTMQEYIEYDGVRFALVNPPTVVREGIVSENSGLNGMTKYSFVFYHPMCQLSNFPFTDVATKNGEEKYLSQNKSFSWIGKPQDYIDKLNKNLQGTVWYVRKSDRFPVEKDDELSEVLAFDNVTVADAIKTGHETWGIPYVVIQLPSTDPLYAQGKRFVVEYGLPSNEIYDDESARQLDTPFVFRMGQGVGLKNNSRTPRNNKIVTRIAGYGSEDNVPYGYPQIVWTGNQEWDYTINNDPNNPRSYPLYKGIVGGQYVKLIKHPFTRAHLMPSIFTETVNKKVNPNAVGYDPTIEIKDYYDAVATQEYPYVNEINLQAPSYESHEFADIKPELDSGRTIGIVSVVPLNADLTPADHWDDTMDDDGNYLQSYFQITLPQLSFDLYACAAITQEMQINMRSGACIGCTFPVQVDWEDYKRNFYDEDGNFVPDGAQRDLTKYPKSNIVQISVVVQKDNNTFGTLMPNIYQQPKANDLFVFIGISLPISYITDAEERLDDAMKTYMLENNVFYFDYPLKFDEYFLATHTHILEQIRPNSIIRFDYGGVEQQLFVKQITVKYGNAPLPQYDITLTDNIDVVLNQIGQVADDVEKLSSLISILRQSYNRNVWNELAKKLSKTQDDVAKGHITFNDGVTVNGDAELNANLGVLGNAVIGGKTTHDGFTQFGSTFAPGLTGFGGQIDNAAHAELRSLTLWEWLEVPELRYNRTEVVVGNVWRAPGGGIIESVSQISATEGIITLKLEDGEIGKIAENDICMGIFHQYVSDDDEYQETINDTEDSDDSKGNFHFSGFYTVYFTVTEITETENNSQFRYRLRPLSTVWTTQHHPCSQMNFVAYGNFSDTTRQSSRYSTLTYERYLRGVATWNFEEGNIAAQFGDLSNLSIHGLEMEGYSAYLNNIYMSGHMKQIDDALAQFSQYNVEFSDHIDVITVDDVGNVIGGLYRIDPDTQEKYDFRINSAMQVRKNGTLLTQVASRADNTDGTFVVYAEPVGCTCEIRNSTIYITSITHVKDGVAGSGDDADFDYDAMRLVRNCYVNLLFDCEGRTTFTKQFPVTIEHDSEPFIGARLDNEHSGVSWVTRTQSYIGLPSFNMRMWRNNEALSIASVNDAIIRTDTQGVTLIMRNSTVPPVTIVSDRIYYYKTIVNGQLHVEITAIGADIPLIVNLNVTASVEYAGVSYERTLVHTITKTTDTNVYSLLPSPTEVIDDGTSLSVSAVDCAVVCDSSDDNHYNVPFSGFATHKIVVQYRLVYTNGQQGAMTTYNGSPVSISRSDNIARVEWFLYGRLANGNPDTTVEHDREGVPVVKNGDSVYTWIKYADSVGGSGYPSVMYDAPLATTEYIGIAHNKQIPTESTIPSDYTWAKIKGDPGNDGTSFSPKGQVVLHYVSRSAMEQDVQQPAQGDYYLCDGDANTPAARATYYRGSWQYDTSASQGDAYVTTDGVQDGHIWVLDGYVWVDLGKIQGPKGDQGPQGLSGCHERLFVGYEPGHYYYNQENDNTSGVRYVDFLAIENAQMASGYSVYMCKTTHTGAVTWTADNTPENWEEVSVNAQSAYFRFLITDALFAKMAHFGAMIIDANWMLTTYGTLYRPATGESWRIDAQNSAYVPISASGGVETWRTYTPDNVCEKFDSNYPDKQGYPSGTPSQEDVLYYYNFVPTSAKNMLTGAAYEGEMHIEGYIRSKGLMLNVEYWKELTHYGTFSPASYTPISGDVDELIFAPRTYDDTAYEYRNNLRLPLPWECPGKKFRFVNNMPYDSSEFGFGFPTCHIRVGQPLADEEWYGITDFLAQVGGVTEVINQKVEVYSEEGENPMEKPSPGQYYDDSSQYIRIGEPITPIIVLADRNMTDTNRGGTVTLINNGNTPGVTDNMTLNNVRSFSLYALPLPEAHDTNQRYWHWLLYDIEWYNV